MVWCGPQQKCSFVDYINSPRYCGLFLSSKTTKGLNKNLGQVHEWNEPWSIRWTDRVTYVALQKRTVSYPNNMLCVDQEREKICNKNCSQQKQKLPQIQVSHIPSLDTFSVTCPIRLAANVIVLCLKPVYSFPLSYKPIYAWQMTNLCEDMTHRHTHSVSVLPTWQICCYI